MQLLNILYNLRVEEFFHAVIYIHCYALFYIP